MEYVVQAIKVSKNLVHANRNAGTPNTGSFLPFSFCIVVLCIQMKIIFGVTKVSIHTGRGKKMPGRSEKRTFGRTYDHHHH